MDLQWQVSFRLFSIHRVFIDLMSRYICMFVCMWHCAHLATKSFLFYLFGIIAPTISRPNGVVQIFSGEIIRSIVLRSENVVRFYFDSNFVGTITFYSN